MISSLLRSTIANGSKHVSCPTSLIRRRLLTTPPKAPNLPRSKWLFTISAFTATSLAAYTLGSIYPPSSLTILFPRIAPGPPDPDSPEAVAYTEQLEQSLQTLAFLQKLRTQPDADQWYETRAYKNFPEERRVNNLTAGTLRGPGKLALTALVRSRKDESEGVVIVHVGRGLCGHDGIVHGGLLATLLDETLGRTVSRFLSLLYVGLISMTKFQAIANLPDRVGVTAQLTLNYRAPTRADQFIVIKTFLTEVKGRKVTVSGRVEDLHGTALVEARYATSTVVWRRLTRHSL